jgi:hypothetical protein
MGEKCQGFNDFFWKGTGNRHRGKGFESELTTRIRSGVQPRGQQRSAFRGRAKVKRPLARRRLDISLSLHFCKGIEQHNLRAQHDLMP